MNKRGTEASELLLMIIGAMLGILVAQWLGIL